MNTNPLQTQELANSDKMDFKYWWSKLKAQEDLKFIQKEKIYLDAIKNLPGSYKLWVHYLEEAVENCTQKCIASTDYESMNATFKRALLFMHKMPRIWIMFFEFLIVQKKYSQIRHTFDDVLPHCY